MDAKEISKGVKDYFLETHGQLAVYGFRIESVSFNKKTNVWEVECSFLESIYSTENNRAYYKIDVDSKGEIKQAERTGRGRKLIKKIEKIA